MSYLISALFFNLHTGVEIVLIYYPKAFLFKTISILVQINDKTEKSWLDSKFLT
jgi:hypothetical protein